MSRIFNRRLPEEAFVWADSLPRSLDIEVVPLHAAAGRILGRDLHAERNMPPQRMAAADGFALRSCDTIGAGDYSPLLLALHPTAARLAHAEATPVRWGDPMPQAADAVLALEFAEVVGTTLAVTRTLAAGDGVAEPGEECRVGELLVPAGRALRPQDLALLAEAGWEKVPVWRKPIVRLLMAGRHATDADGPMLTNLIARDGGCLADVGVALDGASLVAALTRPGADLILVAGATGEGASDHAVASLAQAGVVDIHGVAIHPGGNLALGKVGDTAVVLLPGTPLACFAAYDLLGARILRRLARQPGAWPYRSATLPLARKLASRIGRLELCRVQVRDGLVEPLAVADDRILATVVRADGFVVMPTDSEGGGRGSEVLVHFYD
jgi:molybdopterin molybdotransferase